MPTYTQTLLHNIDFRENNAIKDLIIEEEKYTQNTPYNSPRERANALYNLALSYNDTLAIFLYDCGESEKAAEAAQKAVEVANLALSLYTTKADTEATKRQIIAYQNNATFFKNSISDNESDTELTEIFSNDNGALEIANKARQENLSNSPIHLPVKNDFFKVKVENPLQDFADACKNTEAFRDLFDKDTPVRKRKCHSAFFESEKRSSTKKYFSNENSLNNIFQHAN